MQVLDNLRAWARRIKRDGVTLWFACRNPATPLVAKALAVFVVAYALSPIDLIPDFIPVVGYLDDVLLLPGLIWLAIRLVPRSVVESSRMQADAWMAAEEKKPVSYLGALLVVAVWLAVAYACWSYFQRT